MKNLVTLDWETYYDKDYSLSKITTEAYIRDPRFEAIGLGVRVDDGPLEWLSGTDDDYRHYLRQLNLDKRNVLAHNMAFDGAILHWRYGVNPKFMLDTLSMAKPITGLTVGGSLAALAKKFCLGEKGTEVVNALGKRRKDFTPSELAQYGEYCKNDVLLTYNLFHVLQQFSTPQELYIIDMMLRMFTDPVIELDTVKLERHLSEVRERKQKLLDRVSSLGDADILMSNDKFAELLKKLGVAPPTKTSATTGKEAYAFAKTDPAFKALLEHPDERVQAVVSARLGVKSTLEETRTESFLGIAQRGLLPIMLNYYGAHTGRASGADKMNLQNLPSGGALRYSMRAPKKHIICASDSSQIEARVLPWFAGQNDLVEAFRNGEDIYSKFATGLYGYEVSKKTPTERFVGKTCILGLGFGTGKDKLRSSLKHPTRADSPVVDLTIERAGEIVDYYRATYPMIPALWRECDNAIKAIAAGREYELGVPIKLYVNGDGVQLPNGMWLRYPNLSYRRADGDKIKKDGYYYDTKYGPTALYGAKMAENIVQALARIIVFTQMAKIDLKLRKLDRMKPGLRFKTVLTVHDEVVAIAPEPMEDKLKAMMEAEMSAAPKWAVGLPIGCEASTGYSYGEAK